MMSSSRLLGRLALGATTLLGVASIAMLCGCAEEEYETREPAFPQAIGYTPPPSAAAAQAGAARPALADQPEAVDAPAGDSQEVVVGGEDGDEPEQPGLAPGQSPPTAEAGGDAQPGEYADTDPSALTDFRSALDPYGSWTDDPTYGTVWVPSASVVGADFTPYLTAGHWVYDDDYVWVSDYDWGWAPFHYGRWVWVAGVGWEWIPGRVYAGAWVSWRYGWGDWGYVGWAPLGPTWCWRHGYAVGLGYVPAAPYAFVGTRELFSPVVGTRVVTGTQVGVIGAHTTPYAPPAGRVAATPTVGGPPPARLGIPASAIAHGAVANRGVLQARAFAKPSTAIGLGARPPQAMPSRVASAAYPRSAPGPTGGARMPAYGAPAPSHFGGRLGAGFSGAGVANAPGYGRAYPGGLSSGGARPYFGAPSAPRAPVAPSYRGSFGRGFAGAPAFRGVPSAPAYHGPAPSSGGARPGGGYSGGGFHGGGFSGGGFHGGGFAGGGFHGGGGGGAARGGGRR